MPDDKPKTNEQKLFDAMDAAAVSFVDTLTSDNPDIAFKDKVAAFRLALDWLVKSQRIKPPNDDDMPKGVKEMKEMIAGLDKPSPRRAARRKPKTQAQKRTTDGTALAKAMGVAE
jgi:hypothetical protein